jgi:xanthine dehydrogenase accessory factor
LLEKYVLIKGAGDLASGVACLLHQAGFPVIMTEIAEPTCVRRKVSFAEAVYQGKTLVEGIKGVLVPGFSEAGVEISKGHIPVLIDPEVNTARNHRPEIFIDATMAKKNYGTNLQLGEIVLALGPGFDAGKDVHAVIETQRGPDLGKPVFSGRAAPDTGIPGEVLGYTGERLLRAPADGVFREVRSISDYVEQGEAVAYVDDQPVLAQISGTVRGLLKSGLKVHRGMKAGDIHPAKDPKIAHLVTDKAWTVGMGVLKAILALRGKKGEEKRAEKIKIFTQLDQIMKSGHSAMLYTLVDGGGLTELEIGRRLLIRPEGEKAGSLGLPALDQVMTARGRGNLTGRKETGIITWQSPWAGYPGNLPGRMIRILEEAIVPQKKLIIFGGGHISLPLSEMADILGYRVIVVDDREEFANSKRFPRVDRTVCADFSEVFTKGLLEDEINSATAVVIITRGHRQDRICVRYLAGRKLAYLGMIGSRSKVKHTFTALLEEGFPQEELAKISAPIGLDLGGQSPAEVALSIMAEIVARENHASGKPMSEVRGVILP